MTALPVSPCAPASGSRSSNTLPTPSWLATASVPPMCSTSVLTMARPMPLPWMSRPSAPRRLKGSKSCCCCAADSPGPVSATRSTVCPASTTDDSVTRPPARLYLMALETRLITTWRKRVASAIGVPASDVPACGCRRTLTCRSLARGCSNGKVCCSSGAIGTGRSRSRNSPLSRPDRSSTSFISTSRCSLACCTCCRRWRRCSGVWRASSLSISWV